ncbi:MAG: tripartite tricarboxylate transporter substrate binding protein [Betaproteobacteria bacterium]|nr:tripartite tricarboxylate transporter substrate binding protein [Betaproteobacteria bacterium]
MNKLAIARSYTVLCLLASAAVPAMAQTAYPERAVRLIVPFATGSATDSSARIFGVQMASQLGQQVLVENRAGAGGAIGMQALVKATPDGYTIAYAGAGPLAINRSITPNLPYDVEKEVQAISQAISSPLMLAVSPTLPVKNVKELIALAKARPGQLANGSAGTGTVGHLAGEYFKTLSKTDILHVPYKGGAQAATDAMSGFVQILFDPTSSASPHVRSGRLRGLAVTGPKRINAFPDLPTVAESGVPGYEVTTWGGIIGPVGMPRAIIDKLSLEVQKAAKSKLVIDRYTPLGSDPIGTTPEQFTEFIRKEYLKWAEVIKRAVPKS